MKNVREVPSTVKRKVVFLAIYNQGTKLYKNYPKTEKIDNNLVIPTVLLLNRWDGKIGFPGGHVEEGEDILVALKRELKEEINYTLTETPTLINIIEASSSILHFFALECSSFSDMKNIVRSATQADHFGSEVTGTMLQHLTTYKDQKGLEAFLSGTNLIYGVKDEIKDLLAHMKKKL